MTNSSHIFPIFFKFQVETLSSFKQKTVTAANEAKRNTDTFHASSVGQSTLVWESHALLKILFNMADLWKRIHPEGSSPVPHF